jgi:integrase
MPNGKGRRRQFGSVRRLPSGRYQARYPGPDGIVRPADDTFATKTEAENWLTLKEAEILEDDWIDPDAAEILVPDYAATWIGERAGLRPKTVKIYTGLLRCHIAPHLATVTVGDLTLARVRRWRKKLLDSGVSPITTAKAYRLLRAVMNTALDDDLIKRNPCRVTGAGNEESPERPVLTVAQVYALADAVGPRYRALILLVTFASLRWGELAGLFPQDIDLDACTVSVTRQLNYHDAGYSFGPLKSRAGRRTIAFPALIVPDLRKHLEALPGDAVFAFTSPNGSPLNLSNFRRRVWLPALAVVGLAESAIHLHDLRHTGNQLVANEGANLRELMARMGHDSSRAALIYQHSSAERQRALADKLGDTIRAELGKKPARKPRKKTHPQ